MGKPSAPEPPDISGLVAATEKQADLSYQIAQDQLAWAKEQYATDKETIDKVVNSMLETQDFTQENAEADRARYEATFQPLEDQFVKQVQEYASPERTAFEVGRAQADVAQQFNQAREASQQQLESFGVNPADTRYAALDIGTRTAQAAASAAAGTQAATNVENTQLGLLGEAINIGKGYPNQVAQSYATSLGAGQGAAGATNQATQTASGAMTAPANYITAGNQGYGVSADAQTSLYNSQVNAYNAALQASAGWGGVLGGLTGLAGIGLMQLDKGGEVPDQASPSGGAIPDDVKARLSAGEFVIPADVVAWKGAEHFYKEINKHREHREEMVSGVKSQSKQAAAIPESSTQYFQGGGLVREPLLPISPTGRPITPIDTSRPITEFGTAQVPSPVVQPVAALPPISPTGRPITPINTSQPVIDYGYNRPMPRPVVNYGNLFGGLPPVSPTGRPITAIDTSRPITEFGTARPQPRYRRPVI